MKIKYLLSAVSGSVALLLLILLVTSCGKNTPTGDKLKSDYLVQVYYINPEFEGCIHQRTDELGDGVTVTETLGEIWVDNSLGDLSRTITWRDQGASDKFRSYAERYNDRSYNDYIGDPFANKALAEPLDRVQCFEITSTGEVDVSDKVQLRAISYLPFIESGYKPIGEPGRRVGTRVVWDTESLFYKPLPTATKEDMTLLKVESHRVLDLIPIEPYEFTPNTVLKVVIEENGKTHEVRLVWRK